MRGSARPATEGWSTNGGACDAPDGVSWSIDLSGGIQRVAMKHGCIHYGNGKARANAWNLPDPIPVHREVIYTSRPGSVMMVRPSCCVSRRSLQLLLTACC